MITNYFLATVLGWFFVIMGLFFILRHTVIMSAMNDVMARPGLFLIMALITVIIGLLICVSHNVWVMGWPVIITITGWLVLIKGIVRLYFPEFVHQMWNKMAAKTEVLTISGIIILVIGFYLLYKVYVI